jgi:hypothetical protein
MRTDEEILKTFDENYPEFKWFIKKYFGQNGCEIIEKVRKENRARDLLYYLNKVWFSLPDELFNIISNPKGYRELLQVLEE